MAKSVTKKTATKKAPAKATKKVATKSKKTESVEKFESAKKYRNGTSARTFAKNLKAALVGQERYTPDLDLAIRMAASAMHLESRASAELADCVSLTVIKTSKFGEEEIEHPMLKTQRALTAEARKWLQVLGLTADDIINKQRDALTEFDQYLDRE